MSKLALLVGIEYEGTNAELRGCITDIETTKEVLETKLHYNDIVMLTDHTEVKPTKHNIMKALIHLADRSWDEDVKQIWISYSGHGHYKMDDDGDEDDGKDECLCPLDYAQNGKITDDTMNHILGLIRPDVCLTVVIDACHSGTILDLPYRYIAGKKTSVVENPSCKVVCDAIMISGCKDDQKSQETQIVQLDYHEAPKYAGAMTQAFLQVLKKYDYTVQAHTLILEIRKILRNKNLRQVPQLSCTHKLDPSIMFCISNPKSFNT